MSSVDTVDKSTRVDSSRLESTRVESGVSDAHSRQGRGNRCCRVAQEATLLTQQADELLRELGVNTRSPTTGRRALLTIATNEARFAQALRLAAQVVSGGTSCPATGYCASGTLSMDGRTCCPATCARCGSIECAASPGGAGECCTAHVTATCTTEFATTCAVPIENHHVQGWDLVFFDYTAERAPLDNALVEWSALWARFAPGEAVPAIAATTAVMHIIDSGLRKLEFARRYLNPVNLGGDALRIGSTRADDRPTLASPFARVANYEYILMWDGDGQLHKGAVAPTERWDSCTFLRLMRRSRAGLGQPSYSRGSSLTSWMLDNGQWLTAGKEAAKEIAGLYRYRRMAEVGFWAWRSDWWAPMHAVLVKHHFIFWYYDMLPIKCIVEASGLSRAVNDTGIVVIDALSIYHPPGASTIHLDQAYIDEYEGNWFDDVTSEYKCKRIFTQEQMEGKERRMVRGGGVRADGVWIPQVTKARKRGQAGTLGGLG